MGKYRKIPVVIEAMQFTGVPPDGTNAEAIVDWVGDPVPGKAWINHIGKLGNDDLDIMIPTLEGNMRASLGDWIIKGVEGEFYPCKPDIFAKTYEEVSDAEVPSG